MNLKKYTTLKRVQDLSEAEQTPELKKELYDMILPFVRKYQPIYYAQYKGDIRDLASDMYVSFMTRKGRGEKKENLLDKFDPSVTVLPYLVKVAVQRKLIDYSRSDKGEVNYSENYDGEDDARKLTLNILSKTLSNKEEESLEDIVFTEDFIGEMKDRYNELPKSEKERFKKALAHYRKKIGLYDNFEELFSYLEKDMEEHVDGTITIKGVRPDFTIVFTDPQGNVEETPARSRNIESVLKKARKKYPGAKVAVQDSLEFFKQILYRSLKIKDSQTERIPSDNKAFTEVVIRAISTMLDNNEFEFFEEFQDVAVMAHRVDEDNVELFLSRPGDMKIILANRNNITEALQEAELWYELL